VLEIDRERRRIKLGIKQLQPTSVDEYLGEHSVGETVTGRIVETGSGRARVELGEGIFAECRIAAESAATPASAEPAPAADLSSLTAMLSAKWKQGAAAKSARPEAARAGQIRTFRIVKIDPSSKKIEVELAG
jgi:small subunit ribosomal protein S1